MDDETTKQIKDVISGHLDEYATANQYGVSKIPYHIHNGSDSPQIPSADDFQIKDAYYKEEVNIGNSGASAMINWSDGNKQKITTTGSCTLTFVNPMGPCNLILRVVHTTNATAYTYTWPSRVKWALGTAPITTNTSGSVDIIAFYFDGATYWGQGSLNFS